MCTSSKVTVFAKKSAVIIAVLLIIVIVLIALNVRAHHDENYCETPSCVRASAQILTIIDANRDPCSNFYSFACGNFLKISRDLGIESTRAQEQARIGRQLEAIILEPVAGNDSKTLKLLKQYYRSCANLTAINEDNDKTFWGLVTQLRGWPVVSGNNWNESAFDLMEFIVDLRNLGLRSDWFLNISVNENKTLMVNIPDDVHKIPLEAVQSYVDLMADIAMRFDAYNYVAKLQMREVMHFENRLANLIEEMKNQTEIEPPILTIAEVQTYWQKINWLEFLNQMTKTKLSEDDQIVLAVKSYLPKLDVLLRQTKKRTQVNYVIWKLIQSFAPFLSKKIRDKIADYNKSSRHSYDTWYSDRVLGKDEKLRSFQHTLEAAYLKRHVDRTKFREVEAVIKRIGKQIEKRLIKTGWMDEETRASALSKLRNITYVIGGPEEMYHQSQFEDNARTSKMSFRSDNIIEISTEILSKNLDFLYSGRNQKESPLKARLHELIPAFGARFLRDDNILHIPAGILQDSLYDETRPNFLNYGSIGAIIGHELVHAFDIATSYHGKVWWSSGSIESFQLAAKCFENCTDGTDAAFPEDCNSTLLENFADYTGIDLAYEAYQQWLDENGPEPSLPGLNFTGNQLFWIARASWMCHVSVNETNSTTYDHLIPSSRIVGSFRNSPHFGRDFNCPPNSNMNPEDKCQIL